jgi:hypothetical protein
MNKLYKLFLFILSFHFLLLAGNNSLAQQSTFYEGFESAEEGELPEGWSAWQNGGGANPFVRWSAWKFEAQGVEKYVLSDAEGGREGMIDEDWLISPTITPVENDKLIFLTRISEFQSGDMFHILVSTTSATAPIAFTDTLAAYDETQLPVHFDHINSKITVDLSAYVDTPIHLAFVHRAQVAEDEVSGIWLIDEVEVRPIQEAYVASAFFRQATSPPRPPILTTDQVIIVADISFVLKGDYGSAKITSLKFGTDGTTDLSLIKKIKVYYTTVEWISDDDILQEWVPRMGTSEDIGTTFTIDGEIDLQLGTLHYFWLVAELDTTRHLTFPYPQLDFTFEEYVVNGEAKIPEVRTFFGARDVVSHGIPNDNFIDAAEITSNGRYGSSTMPATYEEAFDKQAYCQNFGFLNIHSVWWYFVPPSNGWISADLSNSKFNTLLTFFDEDFNGLACNDNISDSQMQSLISDFPVEKGKKIYIRVSDFGSYDDDGSQYSESGVVDMNFTFSIPVGINENTDASISAPYPSPASQKTSFDFVVQQPRDIGYTILDLTGKTKLQKIWKASSSGKQTESIDTSTLSAGVYMLKVNAGRTTVVHKLIINH